jgi:hypothetical protein
MPADRVDSPPRTEGRQTAPPWSRSFFRGELHLDQGGAARPGQATRDGKSEPPTRLPKQDVVEEVSAGLDMLHSPVFL